MKDVLFLNNFGISKIGDSDGKVVEYRADEWVVEKQGFGKDSDRAKLEEWIDAMGRILGDEFWRDDSIWACVIQQIRHDFFCL